MGHHEYNKYNVHSYNAPLVKMDISLIKKLNSCLGQLEKPCLCTSAKTLEPQTKTQN